MINNNNNNLGITYIAILITEIMLIMEKKYKLIFQITNEFRFLDDRVLQTPPEPSWLPYPITEFADRTEARGRLSKSERDVAVKNCENLADGSKNNLLHRIDYVGSLEQYFIVIIIGIEISAAFGLLVYGIIRFGKIYEVFSRYHIISF